MAKTRSNPSRTSRPARAKQPTAAKPSAPEMDEQAEADPALEGQAVEASPQMKSVLALPVTRPAGLRALFQSAKSADATTATPASGAETLDAKPTPKPKLKPGPASEIKFEPRPEPKAAAEPKPEPTPEARTEAAPEPLPEPAAEVLPTPVVEQTGAALPTVSAAPTQEAAPAVESPPGPAAEPHPSPPDTRTAQLSRYGAPAGIGLLILLTVAVSLLLLQRSKERAMARQQAAAAASAAEVAAHRQAEVEHQVVAMTAALRQGFMDHGDTGTSTTYEAGALAILQALPAPTDAAGREARRQLRLDLAEIARNRSDFRTAMTHVREAAALEGGAWADLLGGEMLFEAGDCREEAGIRASRILASLPAAASDTTALLAARAQHLLARIATADAVGALQEAGTVRETAVTALKARGGALSASLRAEMKEDFQRREQKLQDALTKNDANLIAEAGRKKEAFDQKFHAELQRREARLQQELAEAQKPSPTLETLQEKAAAAWKAALERAGKAAEASSDMEARRLRTECRVELAGALAVQRKFDQAQAQAETALAESEALAKAASTLPLQRLQGFAASQASDILRLKSLGVPAAQAKPLQSQALALIRRAVEWSTGATQRIPDAPLVWSRLGSAQLRLAALLADGGNAAEAASVQQQATESLRRSERDGGLRELQFLASQRLAALRPVPANADAAKAAAAVQAAQTLANEIAVLRRLLALAWLDGTATGASQESKARLLEHCQAVPETQPWKALVEAAVP